MIEIVDIHKKFGTLEVLKGISFNVKEGEIISIVGPSGAGKTTLLQIMGTLDKADQGKIIINNTDISTYNDKQLSAFRNSNIGFIFQFHQLLPEFTALENIMLPALIAKKDEKLVKKEAMDLLALLNLTNRAKHKPNEMSGGEKQRIAVARALINRPAIVLADEPSGSLDAENKEDLHQLFFTLREELNQTFVIVTHDDRLAFTTDRTIILEDGKISKTQE